MKKTITYIFGITLIGNFVNAETLIYAGNIACGHGDSVAIVQASCK